MELNDAKALANEVIHLLQSDDIVIGGSIRRRKPYVKDIELIAPKSATLLALTDHLVNQGIIAKARYGSTFTMRWGTAYRGMLFKNMVIELFMYEPETRGYITWLRTGPGQANRTVMTALLRGAPFHVADGAVWNGAKQAGEVDQLNITSEQDWFALLGIPYIEPEHRTDKSYRALLQRGHAWGKPELFRNHSKPVQMTLF